MRQYCKKYRQNEQNPFAVVSWQDDFLYKIQELVDCFIQEQNISMQDIVLVFPNARPKRYLTARYKKSAGTTGRHFAADLHKLGILCALPASF